MANIVRWFADVSAAAHKLIGYFLRPRHPASAETFDESATVETGAVANAPVTADVNVGLDTGIDHVAHSVPDTQEIERRRNLVRVLFNDFWSGVYEKPAMREEKRLLPDCIFSIRSGLTLASSPCVGHSPVGRATTISVLPLDRTAH